MNDSEKVDPHLLMLQEDEFKKPKVQRNKILKSISEYFNEFSANTSIHGFKYLATGRGCTVEKLWWFTVLFLCIYICTGFIAMTFKKKDVFVSFRQPALRIWDIPFPAITICPANKIKVTKYNFTHYEEKYGENKLDKEEVQHFLDMDLICRNLFYEYHPLRVAEHKFTTESINFFLEHSFSLEDILEFCTTHKKHNSCLKHFSPIITTSGLCFSFNMLDRSELFTNVTYMPKNHISHQKTAHWTFDNNYIKTLNATFPIRITSIIDGLFLMLRYVEPESDKSCEKFKGFKMILHHPGELPILSNRYVLLAPDEHYKIWIKPEVMTTSSRLKTYDPHKRECFFSNERPLKFFKINTAHNCKLECAANYTLKRCGCVPFYIPHEESTPICGFPNMSCVTDAKEEFLNLDVELDIFRDDAISAKQRPPDFCDCLPSCTSIMYNSEVSPERTSKLNGNFSSIMVHLAFKDTSVFSMERNELFSNADFWATCGGLLGLFTGFSVVSLAEIVYFLTLKWVCNLWIATRRFW